MFNLFAHNIRSDEYYFSEKEKNFAVAYPFEKNCVNEIDEGFDINKLPILNINHSFGSIKTLLSYLENMHYAELNTNPNYKGHQELVKAMKNEDFDALKFADKKIEELKKKFGKHKLSQKVNPVDLSDPVIMDSSPINYYEENKSENDSSHYFSEDNLINYLNKKKEEPKFFDVKSIAEYYNLTTIDLLNVCKKQNFDLNRFLHNFYKKVIDQKYLEKESV